MEITECPLLESIVLGHFKEIKGIDVGLKIKSEKLNQEPKLADIDEKWAKIKPTRVYDIQEITIPLTEELKYYLDKVGDPSSPFVLGKLKEGYSETTLLNRKNRFRQEINTELKKIGTKLGLHVPLLMSTARDCYAMTLKRNGVSREFTSDTLGHSDIRTTSHYLDSLSIDESFAVNNNLLKRKNRKTS